MVSFGEGGFYNIFDIKSIPNGIETHAIVYSSLFLTLRPDTCYNVKLKRLGKNWRDYELFELLDAEPIFIGLESKSELDILDHQKFIKQFKECLTSLGDTAKDNHVANSIIANYIGTDITSNKVDGFGSCYVGGNQNLNNLKSLNSALNNTVIPVRILGVNNLFNINLLKVNNLKKELYGKLRNISWSSGILHLPDSLNNAEFKCAADLLSIENLKNIQNNLDFIESLSWYILKNKEIRISDPLYNKICLEALGDIDKFRRSDLDIVSKIFDETQIDIQAVRVGSFYKAFGFDDNRIIKNVKDTLENNLVGIKEQIREIIGTSKSIETEKRTERQFKNIMLVKRAFLMAIPRTQENIVNKLIELGETPKNAQLIFQQLIESGSIFSPDGSLYRFTREKELKQ
jgi:hypothetical protein